MKLYMRTIEQPRLDRLPGYFLAKHGRGSALRTDWFDGAEFDNYYAAIGWLASLLEERGDIDIGAVQYIDDHGETLLVAMGTSLDKAARVMQEGDRP